MDMEITSINEYVSSTYGENNIPEDLLEACRVEALYEATKREVQLGVYFKQAFDSLRGKKWTVKEIDKAITKIEDCNKYIDQYNDYSDENTHSGLKLFINPVFWIDILKHTFYAAAIGICTAAFFKAYGAHMVSIIRGGGAYISNAEKNVLKYAIPAIAGTSTGLDHYKHNYANEINTKSGVLHRMFDKLYRENEKALKWLKEERERILNGTAKKKKLGDIITGKQESTIFANIEII